MDKSVHYGKCVILGCNRPATVRNFACLHGPWMLKPDHIAQYKSGVTLKICAGHYNEDLRLYPRDKTPKSDHPPYPVTDEEKRDYWAKVAAFSSSTSSAPIRATAPKPPAAVAARSGSCKISKPTAERTDDEEKEVRLSKPKKPAHQRPLLTKEQLDAAARQVIDTPDGPVAPIVIDNYVLYPGDVPSDLPQDVWETLLKTSVIEEQEELDHEVSLPKFLEMRGYRLPPSQPFSRPRATIKRRPATQQEQDDTTETEAFIATKLGKRKPSCPALEISKLHAKRRRVHAQKDGICGETTTTAGPADKSLSDKFVPNITLTFNLSNDPCMKYSLGTVADKDYECASYTSFRLRSEVIYVETSTERYELSWTGSRPATLPTTPVGASTTRKDVMLDTYRWARVRDPRQLDAAVMSLLDVPLPDSFVEEIETDLDWSEIEWGPNSIRVRGVEYRLRSILFIRTRRSADTLQPAPQFEQFEEEEEQGFFDRATTATAPDLVRFAA